MTDNEHDMIWRGWEWACFDGVAWYGILGVSTRSLHGVMVESEPRWPHNHIGNGHQPGTPDNIPGHQGGPVYR